jgi:ATP-dependent Lhr-like helicase
MKSGSLRSLDGGSSARLALGPTAMKERSDALEVFHPLIRAWFVEQIGKPTEVQRLTWGRIADGRHVLATAPTGSGKTLAAFLWALDRLLSGAWPGGAVRVLYVSPLKALNNDIRRNLLRPLEELTARFKKAGEPVPEVRVLTRSGDTPAEERARMARRPPEILITTPESLNILLTSRRGRAMLSGLTTVILDEIHAVISSKRGVHLISAVERLVRLSGEFQRLALSATVRPLARVAEWVGGYEVSGLGDEAVYRRRPVAIVEAPARKRYRIEARFPGDGADDPAVVPDAVWSNLVRELRVSLARNRSTLVFANSRRLVEKVTRLVNEEEPAESVYSHHGSLSREVRAVVEERLKNGELRGIVATNSLELGIDIGALDEVVLVQTPPTIASAVQRIGRAGHAVGETSRGTFLPLFPRDLLAAAVVARAVLDGDIEPVQPVEGALDVLAQVILSAVVGETWRVDELFAALRACDPYHGLSRRQFNLVLEMLAGRYAEARVRELKPLVALDRVDGTVRALPGAERLVYLSGGTIPDRGYYHLRVADSGALLGELDEEFVWERSVGDTFTLGVQTWRIDRITHNDVLVRLAHARQAMAPFWRADERDRGFELAEKVGLFLETAEGALEDPLFRRRLEEECVLDAKAAAALLRYLEAQKAATGMLPHRHRLVAERVTDPQGKGERTETILHTFWGGRVNRPFAIALQAAWQRRHGVPLEVIHDDDCVVVSTPGPVRAEELLALVSAEDVEALLREQLETTGFFGARFRAAAGCALLLPREGFRRRTPLWLSRQRAKELLEAVRRFEDFPILLEAWRACLRDEFDLGNLRHLLDEVRDGRISVHEVSTAAPSPFAANASWKRTNTLMYEDDTPSAGRSQLRSDLLRELVFASHLRPRIPRSVLEPFQRKLQRLYPGYSPRSAVELFAWAVERVVIPLAEWRELLAAVTRDHGIEPGELLADLTGKLVAVSWFPESDPSVVCAVESLPRIVEALGRAREDIALTSPALDGATAGDARAALVALSERLAASTGEAGDEGDPLADLLGEFLRFYGPLQRGALGAVLPLDAERERAALEVLVDGRRVVVDEISDGADEPEICDTENLERLLRLTRAAARPELKPLPADHLPAFLATWQGLDTQGSGIEDLQATMERLFGYSAPAEIWETEILPARLEPYVPAWLDALLAESDLAWLGCGRERLAFVLSSDRALFSEVPGEGRAQGDDSLDDEVDAVLPAGPGRFSFEELLAYSGLASAQLARRLWALAWNGHVVNDGFAAVRRGVETRFRPVELKPRPEGRLSRRPRFERWKGSRPFAGSWSRVAEGDRAVDALEAEELAKDRARILLDRYGVVFRELLEHELPALQWGRMFRALRLMELGGEVVAGQFFTGLPGLQFASHAALRRLRGGVPEDGIWWVNAADPASPCGLPIDGLVGSLPRRVSTSHLVFHGHRLVVSSERRGRVLSIRVGPDHPDLARYLAFLRVLLTRAVRPMRAVVVETINGDPAASTPYRAALAALFHTTRDGSTLRLMRRY